LSSAEPLTLKRREVNAPFKKSQSLESKKSTQYHLPPVSYAAFGHHLPSFGNFPLPAEKEIPVSATAGPGVRIKPIRTTNCQHNADVKQ